VKVTSKHDHLSTRKPKKKKKYRVLEKLEESLINALLQTSNVSIYNANKECTQIEKLISDVGLSNSVIYLLFL